MAQHLITEVQAQEVLSALEKHKTQNAAARALGIPRATLQNRLDAARSGRFARGVEFEVPPAADTELPVDELLAFRKRQFEIRQAAEEKNKLLPVTVRLKGPVGILWFGDPHVDDDGCDLALLEAHAKLVRETPGLWGASMGDVSNNWVGRLARLYGQQSTSAKQAWQLVEWFVGLVDWLILIDGNHDLWSGAGDPIKWMVSRSSLHQEYGARLSLNFPNGSSVFVNGRHEFAGSSIYNPAHGQMKKIHLGTRDHILVGGHKHVSGYGVLKDPATGRICHGLQVASYKVYDKYAKEKGFADGAFGPSALTVIDPDKPDNHPDKIKVFWDPFEGAWYLNKKRAA